MFLARSKINHILASLGHQTVCVQAKLRIYPGTLAFELRQSRNQVNGCGKVGVGLLKFCQWGQGWWRKIVELNRIKEIINDN